MGGSGSIVLWGGGGREMWWGGELPLYSVDIEEVEGVMEVAWGGGGWDGEGQGRHGSGGQ